MKHFHKKMGGIATAALLSFCLLGATGAGAQQAYDPMRVLIKPSVPAEEKEGAAPIATNPDFENMPDTAGVEETYYQCVACHSTAIIQQQRVSDARWDYLWNWMIEKQGMPETDEETKKTILSYLKTHFSSER